MASRRTLQQRTEAALGSSRYLYDVQGIVDALRADKRTGTWQEIEYIAQYCLVPQMRPERLLGGYLADCVEAQQYESPQR